ncbi:MAG: WD40/YVTN/BNR-like repeat-containing protein, partial [bacterium]
MEIDSLVRKTISYCLFILCVFVSNAFAQEEKNDYQFDPALYQAMQWRNIGPFRGGRSTAVAGVPEDPLTYYFGSTGGGVWKTEDGGVSWKNISDKFFKTGSVGAIAVAPSDANVIYVGMGEACVRGVTTSSGDGVYKSTDAGKTWTHLGLEKTRQISAIRVHPENPDLVYVAAQGSPWGANAERGIYRSKDGVKSWHLVKHVDKKSGASDLSMDATNPRVLYAAFWEHQRTPWKINSGGPGSGIYKSTDGGDTWEELSKGLPDLMGKIGVAVSPANPNRVWAIIEAEEGGLFRSDDAGKSWRRVNKERVLRARAWYYTHVFADPLDEETVYVLNSPVMKSTDGGNKFTRIRTPHGDNHDLWINPNNNKQMINGNDGGANISFNGGKTWSTQANQPTAQFYRVITDNRFPYYVYGGQQDNSTVAIASRAGDSGIGREDWYPVGGCESAYVAFNPNNPVLVYAGCYQGQITEYNHDVRQSRNVMAYPYLGLGADARDLKYRFNWNAPILASPHNPNVIYHAGNVLLKSEDRGQTWTEISPDLTRNEEEKQGNGGGPITNEAAGGETYNTIFYVVESEHEAGTIWTGSDDGLVHITRDGGKTWNDVTPKGIGEAQINAIEVSPHDPATAYIAVTGYKLDDFKPYIFKTGNYGKSWKRLVKGIPEESFVRVVREDPNRQGLLYAGTETGVFVSFDDGKQWQPFQLNLPVVPVTDLTIHSNDLIAATQGRAFWILDDLTPLHQINDQMAKEQNFLFAPRTTVLTGGGSRKIPGIGQNPPNGAIIYYFFAQAPDTSKVEVKLEILDSDDHVVKTYTAKKKPGDPGASGRFQDPLPKNLPIKEGMNRFVWNLRREDMSRVPKLFTYGNLQGFHVAPGAYTARLTVGEVMKTQP